jgi:hypothetical protein
MLKSIRLLLALGICAIPVACVTETDGGAGTENVTIEKSELIELEAEFDGWTFDISEHSAATLLDVLEPGDDVYVVTADGVRLPLSGTLERRLELADQSPLRIELDDSAGTHELGSIALTPVEPVGDAPARVEEEAYGCTHGQYYSKCSGFFCTLSARWRYRSICIYGTLYSNGRTCGC